MRTTANLLDFDACLVNSAGSSPSVFPFFFLLLFCTFAIARGPIFLLLFCSPSSAYQDTSSSILLDIIPRNELFIFPHEMSREKEDVILKKPK